MLLSLATPRAPPCNGPTARAVVEKSRETALRVYPALRVAMWMQHLHCVIVCARREPCLQSCRHPSLHTSMRGHMLVFKYYQCECRSEDLTSSRVIFAGCCAATVSKYGLGCHLCFFAIFCHSFVSLSVHLEAVCDTAAKKLHVATCSARDRAPIDCAFHLRGPCRAR